MKQLPPSRIVARTSFKNEGFSLIFRSARCGHFEELPGPLSKSTQSHSVFWEWSLGTVAGAWDRLSRLNLNSSPMVGHSSKGNVCECRDLPYLHFVFFSLFTFSKGVCSSQQTRFLIGSYLFELPQDPAFVFFCGVAPDFTRITIELSPAGGLDNIPRSSTSFACT